MRKLLIACLVMGIASTINVNAQRKNCHDSSHLTPGKCIGMDIDGCYIDVDCNTVNVVDSTNSWHVTPSCYLQDGARVAQGTLALDGHGGVVICQSTGVLLQVPVPESQATGQLILDATQARDTGNKNIKPCSPTNYDLSCYDPTLPHVTSYIYYSKETCAFDERVDCMNFNGYWFPIGKIVFADEKAPPVHDWHNSSNFEDIIMSELLGFESDKFDFTSSWSTPQVPGWKCSIVTLSQDQTVNSVQASCAKVSGKAPNPEDNE